MRLDERHVLKIGRKVRTCWQDLGKKLTLQSRDLQEVDQSCNLSREKAAEMIRIWMQKEPDATVNTLVDALENMGKEEIAQEVSGM